MFGWFWRRVGRIGMPAGRRGLGRAGERHAAKLLKKAGYRILGRNVRVRSGEADLVCEAPDRQTIVIVEVKTRNPGESASAQGSHVPPEASVHAWKKRKLLEVARELASANTWQGRPLRIDIVAVEWQEGRRPPLVRHYPDIVMDT